MGSFDDLIPASKSSGSFDDLIPGGKPGNSESFLKRAMGQAGKSLMQAANPSVENQMVAGLPLGPAGGMVNAMSDQFVDSISNNSTHPLERTFKDPRTYAGLALGSEGVTKGVGKVIGGIKNPSKAFGQGITNLQEAAPNQKVDFLGIIRNSMDDPKAAKVLDKSGVLEKFGGTKLTPEGTVSENLSNLTLQESQDLVNAVKDGVRVAVKEGHVKPTEIGIAKMFSELSKAQKTAFKGFDKVKRNYGVAKTVGKAASKYGKRAAIGAVTGAAGAAGANFMWDLLNKGRR